MIPSTTSLYAWLLILNSLATLCLLLGGAVIYPVYSDTPSTYKYLLNLTYTSAWVYGFCTVCLSMREES